MLIFKKSLFCGRLKGLKCETTDDDQQRCSPSDCYQVAVAAAAAADVSADVAVVAVLSEQCSSSLQLYIRMYFITSIIRALFISSSFSHSHQNVLRFVENKEKTDVALDLPGQMQRRRFHCATGGIECTVLCSWICPLQSGSEYPSGLGLNPVLSGSA